MQIGGINQVAQIIESGNVKLFPKTGIGDVVSAQIMSKSDSEVTIKLENGNVITASVNTPIDAEIGETVQLMIKDKVDGKILLETLKGSNSDILKNSNLPQIKNLLATLGLSPSEKNVGIASEMVGRQMPVTRESIQNILINTAKFADLSIKQAVFMAANGLGIEEKNIELLGKYEEGKNLLGKQLSGIKQQVAEIRDIGELRQILTTLNHIDTNKAENVLNKITEKVMLKMSTPDASTEITESILDTDQGKQTKPNANILSKIEMYEKESFDTRIKFDLNQETEQISNKAIPQEELLRERDIQKLKNYLIRKIDILIEKADEGTKQTLRNFVGDFENEILRMPKQEINNLLAQLSKNDRKALIDAVINHLSNMGEIVKDEASFLKGSEEVKNDIRKHFDKLFVSNTSDNLENDIQVSDKLRDSMVKIDAIRDIISSKPENSEIVKMINTAEENITFMKTLSEYNSFVQIPLNIWGKETSGDLFVLKKAKRKINPDNASLFLSLEMPNIGTAECFVKVQNKNVDCSFKMQNEKLVNFLRENSSKLVKTISDLGYSAVMISCGVLQKRTSLVDLEDELTKDDKNRNQSIDIRI